MQRGHFFKYLLLQRQPARSIGVTGWEYTIRNQISPKVLKFPWTMSSPSDQQHSSLANSHGAQ